jgi:hypothetical protein
MCTYQSRDPFNVRVRLRYREGQRTIIVMVTLTVMPPLHQMRDRPNASSFWPHSIRQDSPSTPFVARVRRPSWSESPTVLL